MNTPQFWISADVPFVVAINMPEWLAALQYPKPRDHSEDRNATTRSVAAVEHLRVLRGMVSSGAIVLRESASHQPVEGRNGPGISDLIATDDVIAFCANAGILIGKREAKAAVSSHATDFPSRASETPADRKRRLVAEHAKLSKSGNKKPSKTLAEQEGISIARLGKLMREGRSPKAPKTTSNNPFDALIKTSRGSSS